MPPTRDSYGRRSDRLCQRGLRHWPRICFRVLLWHYRSCHFTQLSQFPKQPVRWKKTQQEVHDPESQNGCAATKLDPKPHLEKHATRRDRLLSDRVNIGRRVRPDGHPRQAFKQFPYLAFRVRLQGSLEIHLIFDMAQLGSDHYRQVYI